MNDRSAENYIPGSSLSARRSSVLKNDELCCDVEIVIVCTLYLIT